MDLKLLDLLKALYIKLQNKNIKKVQRINESQLRAIVAESVKKVLNENDFVNGKLNPFQSPEVRQAIMARNQAKTPYSNNNVKSNTMPSNSTTKKYYTPEQATAMGYKMDEYQDTTKDYEIWRRGKEAIKVCKPSFVKKGKRSPSADWDGSEYICPKWNPIKESKLNRIISESIKNALRESLSDFHHTEVGGIH